ncbi:MAG: gephyrin-like molybdotransferase Glp [Candidatus Acidiferrales bacterium]
MLSAEEARAKVIEIVAARAGAPATEEVDIARHAERVLGRILGRDVVADRNYPPFDRSTRDGFAVRSSDASAPEARLRLVGESRAGVPFEGTVGAGQCVRILTGAPVPRGANAVVMQEHARAEGDFVVLDQPARPGQNFVFAGEHARVGEIVVPRGSRLGYAELAVLAEVGRVSVPVTRRPRVAIVSTGDELVPVDQAPGPFQIRNSNSISLCAQVALAGGEPIMACNAHDTPGELRERIGQGLESDILILSGGVSVGKYDLVEQVLRELGAEFFFDAAAIRPGKPAVFGWCHGKPVFGLPGNPVSTMVTFELFAAPAIELLGGFAPQPLPLFKAKLLHPVAEKQELTHFLPARVTWPLGESCADPVVETIPWEGSGDIGAVVRGNCFLVVRPSRLHLEQGEWVDVLPQRGKF